MSIKLDYQHLYWKIRNYSSFMTQLAYKPGGETCWFQHIIRKNSILGCKRGMVNTMLSPKMLEVKRGLVSTKRKSKNYKTFFQVTTVVVAVLLNTIFHYHASINYCVLLSKRLYDILFIICASSEPSKWPVRILLEFQTDSFRKAWVLKLMQRRFYLDI